MNPKTRPTKSKTKDLELVIETPQGQQKFLLSCQKLNIELQMVNYNENKTRDCPTTFDGINKCSG